MVKGERFYFNGNLCKHNHLSPRRTSSKCRQCVIERDNARYKKTTEGKTKRVRDIKELTLSAKKETKDEAIKNNRRYFVINCCKCNLLKVHDVKSIHHGCIECIRTYKAKHASEAYIPKERKEETYNTIENILYMSAQKNKEKNFGGHVAPHGGRAAPLAAGARLIAAPTPRRRHLTQRGASRRRRQNRRELAARPRQQKHQPSTSPSLLVSSRLVAGAHARDVRSYRRVRSAKDDSNREPVGAAAARGGKTHDAHLMEMLLLWHLLI